MAATTRVYSTISLGQSEHLQVGDISLDNSYPAGGYSVRPSGISRWDAVLVTGPGGYDYHWERGAQKLRVYRTGTSLSQSLQEVPATTDLSAITGLNFLAVGA